MSVRPIPVIGDSEFTIQPSDEAGTKQLAISPDSATCADCVAGVVRSDGPTVSVSLDFLRTMWSALQYGDRCAL